jgi:chromosome segregation ATPase
MTIDIETIVTAISSVGGWIVSKKFVVPYIVKAYEWIRNYKKEQDKENIDSSKELIEIKEQTNNVYENQLEFCMKQIAELQTNLTDKQKELNDYINQLSELRNKIVELQKQLYESQMKYSKLSSLCCSNKECQFRQSCNE